MPPKIRIMPSLLFKDVGLVKGIGFDSWRRVGSAMQSVKVYNMREVDELVFLDISATRDGRPPDFDAIDELADECFMPLAVGGGIRTLEDVRRLLQVGADKVVLNTAALENPDLVSQIAHRFGAQCVVVSIDFRGSGERAQVYTRAGSTPAGLHPAEWARSAEFLGAGEILLTSIERDGAMCGYDIETTRQVASAVSIPVIASGGASCYDDMHRVIAEAGVPAVAAASIFHFTQQTPLEAKQYLRDHAVPVRL